MLDLRSSRQGTHVPRRWHAVIFVAFVLAQVLDGALTYAGLQTFGIEAEGNHLLSWWMHYLGPSWALAGAKGMAIGCGAILYVTGLHAILGILTGIYLLVAVAPWLALLSS